MGCAELKEMREYIDETRVRNISVELKNILPNNTIEISLLLHHPDNEYFVKKLSEIARLESEISRVEIMTQDQYSSYRDNEGNCKLLKTKHSLISNNMRWINHFWGQINAVYNRKK